MSVIIQRYLPRFTVLGACLTLLGIGIYLLNLGQTGTAQSNPNAGPTLLQSADIGHVGQPGAYVTLDGEHAISSFGSDIWETRDGFHFAYRPWNGDGEFIAYVHDMTDTHPRARAGIMVRETLDPESPNAFVTATPQHGIHFLRRRARGEDTYDDAHTNLGMTTLNDRTVFQRRFRDLHPDDKSNVNQFSLPRWFKLIRAGDQFHAYDSADGLTWEWIGTESISMVESVFVGLAVSSRDPQSECVARFSNVSFGPHSLETAATRLITQPVIGQGDGLKGRYFADRTFSNEIVSRIDPQLDFVWYLDPPAERMPRDHFTVRWEGLLEAQYTEPYLLHLVSDQQAMLWLDGRLLIDDWFEHRATETSALVNLEAGKKYHLRVDYTEATAHAMVSLGWSSPSTKRDVIPQSQLYAQLADEDGDNVPDAWESAFQLLPGAAELPPAVRNTLETHRGSIPGLASKALPELVREHYLAGKNPAGQAGRTKNVDQASGWKSLDLSPAGPNGTANGVATGRQRIAAAGARYGEVNGEFPHVLRDKFHFSYQPKSGDHELVAQILDIESAGESALAGLMARQSNEPNSPFVAVMVSPNRESWLLFRSRVGYGARMERLGAQANWLKLVRRSTSVSVFESTDGQSWRWLANEPFPGVPEACLGLAAQGAGMAAAESVDFGDIQLRPLQRSDRNLPGVVGQGDGLLGHYQDQQHAFQRIDSEIDFDWTEGQSPSDSFSEDHFTVTWEGELQAQYTEPYFLEVRCDDGARLWLDGLLLLDDWRDSGDYPRNIRVELEAGRRYPIRLEYYEATGDAMAHLNWSSPSTPKQTIPQSQLYSERGPDSFSIVGRGNGPRLPRDTGVPAAADIAANQLMGPPAPNENDTFLQLIQTLDPAAFVDTLGAWEVDDLGVVCTSRRGRIDYEFQVDQPAMYLLEITGEAAWPHPDPNYLLWIDVDTQHLSRRLLTPAPRSRLRQEGGPPTARQEGGSPTAPREGGSPQSTLQLTPWLTAGTHRLSLYWDNTLPARALRLTSIQVQRLDGPDANNNQISDWMEVELARSNGIESATESDVSPATVEGRSLYWNLIQAQVGSKTINVGPGAGERWSLSLPLDPSQATQVDLAFENNGLLQTHQVTWKPTDLATTGPLTVRQGDSLLLTIDSNGVSPTDASFTVAGQQYQLAAGAPVVHQFNQSGQHSIQVANGPGQSRIVPVTVIAPIAPEPIAALAGHWREWSPPDILDAVVLEPDPLVELNELVTVDGSIRYRLRSYDPVTRYINLRLGSDGSILQQIAVEGFRLDHGNRMGPARVAEYFDDGSRNIEVDLIMMPHRSGVSVEGQVLAGGILYASGTLNERYSAADFDPLGILTQTFFMTSTSKTSVCHEINTFQGSRQINEF